MREAAMQPMTQSDLESELEIRLRELGYSGGVSVYAIGSDGKWGARLNVDDGPPWDIKRRLIELTSQLGREYFIDYID